MKKSALFFVKCICFFSLLGLVVFVVYDVLKWKDTTGDYLSSVEQLYATEDDLIDVVFVGSSHCYCGIYPSVLWQQYGIAAFDMSVSSQDKNSSFHDLVELYKTQSPSVIFVDLHALTYDKHLVEANVYRNYLSLRTSPNSVALVNAYIDQEERGSFYLRFPIIHTRYRELKKYDFLQYPPNTFGRGELYISEKLGTSWADSAALNDRTVGELSDLNRQWLLDLIELAEEHGTAIEFMVLPYARSPFQQEIFNAAQEVLNELQYSYTDFNQLLDELGLDLANDYVDPEHMNAYGARKVSEYLGRTIAAEYDLPDHREDERYWQWDADCRWCENNGLSIWLSGISNPVYYASGIKRYTDGITLVSLDGDYLDSETDYFEILKPLGMRYEEYLAGGKWIYRDGALEKIAENVMGAEEVYYDLGWYDTVKLTYVGPLSPENIMIDREPYQSASPLTFITYDAVLEKVVAQRAF